MVVDIAGKLKLLKDVTNKRRDSFKIDSINNSKYIQISFISKIHQIILVFMASQPHGG
jgi:hypothetical protein